MAGRVPAFPGSGNRGLKEKNLLDKEYIKLGISPVNWTNDDMPELGDEISWEQCVSEAAEAGFAGTEIGHKYPVDWAELKYGMAEKGLVAFNAWMSTYFVSKPYKDNIKAFRMFLDKMKYLGASTVMVSEQGNSIQARDIPVISPQKPVFTLDELAIVAKGYDEMGHIALNDGIYLTVHHHMGTAVETLVEIDQLMDRTSPDRVFLLFDSAHSFFAGDDPEELLKKYVSRTRVVHAKDIRKNVLAQVEKNGWSFKKAVLNGIFTVVGDGDIEFEPLFKILSDADYKGWICAEAEQDPAKANPLEYAKLGMAKLRELTLL